MSTFNFFFLERKVENLLNQTHDNTSKVKATLAWLGWWGCNDYTLCHDPEGKNTVA